MSHRNPRSNTQPVLRRPPHVARWLAAAIAVLVTATTQAQRQTVHVEECLESGTRLVSLPGSPGGSLSASECRGCESLRLGFDAATRYFIGDEAVSYARLREAAGQKPAALNVCYDPKNRTLTRLRLAATGANR